MTNPQDLSWDAQRSNVPERPAREAQRPTLAPVQRPRRTGVVVWLAMTALALWIVVVALGWLRFETLHAELLTVIPSDVSDDYTSEDIDDAASLLLGATGALGSLLAAMLMWCATAMHRRRSSVARIVGLVTAVLSVAVIVVAGLLGASLWELIVPLTAQAIALVVVTILMFTPQVSRWLNQQLTRETVPLTQLRERR